MFGVFAYLTAASIRNRFAGMLKQIRSPRYALALLFGIAYIVYFIYNSTMMPRGGPDGPGGPFARIEFELLAALGLFVLFMRWWLFGNDRSALAFTPAEVQFFFPAPVSRRALIQFKLLRAQIPIMFNALLWVLLLRRGGTELPGALRAVSIWALFTIFMLHRLGATLVRAAAIEHGKAGVKRNAVALAVFGAAAALLAWSVVQAYPSLRASTGFGDAIERFGAVLQQPIPSALLAPFRVLLAPTFSHTPREWAIDLLPVVLIAALHYLWVIRTELAFEDAAVEASAQRAKLIEAMRARQSGQVKPVRAGSRTWIRLAPRGHPAVAILWKNMMALARSPARTTLIVTLVLWFTVMATMLTVMGGARLGAVVGYLALGLAAVNVLVGARFVRTDLRQDLVNLRLLRTYPLEGSALVAAEVAGSTIVLTISQMLLLVFAHAMFLSDPGFALDIRLRWLLVLVAPIALLILNAVSVTIQNAVALLFPAWVRIGTARQGGVEMLGQGILTTLASLIAFTLALLPAGLVAVIAFAGIRFVAPGALMAAGVTAAILALATLAFEVAMAMTMLGEVFERGEMVTSGSP